MPAKLQSFLSDFHRSRSREYVLTTRLVHDLTVAAAERGYDLLVYLPTVDSDGFDLILDDRDRLVPIQLKSIVKGGRASKWEIRRKLLRPDREFAESYGFESSPYGVGRAGGVVLTTVEKSGEAKVGVSYAYTDVDVLSAMWQGILPLSAVQKKRLQRLRDELSAEPDGTVAVPRSAFLHAASPEHLLALCGLHSRFEQPWRLQLRKLLGQVNTRRTSDVPVATLRENIRRYLDGLLRATE
jgi:hypothetical protein